MAFLDALFQDIREAPDTARKIFSFLNGQPGQPRQANVTGGMPPTNTPPTFPVQGPDNRIPREQGTGLSKRGAALAAVPVGPTATPPALTSGVPMGPVNLGPTALNTPPPMPQPPAPAKLTTRQRIQDALVGFSAGPKAAIDLGNEQKNAPIAAWDDANKREMANNAAILNTRKGEAEITRDQAQAANLNAEAQARLNPQPKNKPVVVAGPNGEPLPALQNEETGVITDSSGTPIPNPQMWEKPVAAKEPNEQDRIAREWIDAHPKDYPADANGNRYIASNMAKARLAQRAEQSKAEEKPEKPPRTLLEVPQADGTSKIIEATPGMTVPAGARTPTQAGNINQMEQTRADMAENVNENLAQLEKIVGSRPDLFGKIAGPETQLRQWIGTDDPDIAAMKQISDNLGRAQTSAHGMRNGKLVEDAIVGILNGYKNGPDAVKRAIQTARDSVKTFTADVESKGGKTGTMPAAPQAPPTKANDPLGIR